MTSTALTQGRFTKSIVAVLAATMLVSIVGCKSTRHTPASKPAMQPAAGPATAPAAEMPPADPAPVAAASPIPAPAPAPVHQEITVTSAQVWDDLLAGNVRYAEGKSINPNRSALRRLETAAGQRPFAVILSCSDSRVPPEVVFDTGVGELFVVRVAGNTAGESAIGSIEYAVDHLHVPLIVVMGHDRCGAVDAAVTAYQKNQAPKGHLPAVTDPILPAVHAAKAEKGDLLDHTTNEHVIQTVRQLQQANPILAEAIANKRLAVIGCRYDLKTGRVTAITPAPVTQE